jgi:UDP-glucose 4-epimerase
MLHILEAIRQTKRPIRLVYASSAAVYGDSTDLPCRDDQPLTGAVLSPYALQKKQMEEEAALYEKLHRIPSLGLRYFNVYGPRQDPTSSYAGVISLFYQSYQEDKELLVYGDGLQSRDFISVKEVARANLLALQSDYHGVLNIATGQPQTLLQLISYIEATGNHSAKVRFLPARPGDILHSFGAAEKTAACLGFCSQQSLAAGIKDLIG